MIMMMMMIDDDDNGDDTVVSIVALQTFLNARALRWSLAPSFHDINKVKHSAKHPSYGTRSCRLEHGCLPIMLTATLSSILSAYFKRSYW
jgi:hypothetical protein